jgi:putative tributyrin esterase
LAFCELKFFSQALQKATAADVILPEGKTGPFYTFYLLHGLSDDHTIWQRRTSIERYVQDLPLIVVMPDGGRGFYCDAKAGMAWETALVRDLVGYVDTVFQTRTDGQSRCIGGLSMGGYGALKLALKYPDRFSSAVSHSGATAFGHRPFDPAQNDAFAVEFRRIVGENPQGGPDDIFALAEKVDTGKRPHLRFDCGTEDFLLADNRELHDHLGRIGYLHEYEEFPGSHEWGYWDRHVQEAIRFHTRNLGLST